MKRPIGNAANWADVTIKRWKETLLVCTHISKAIFKVLGPSKAPRESNRKRLKDTLTTIPPINDVEEGIALKNAQLRFKEENTKHVRWKLRICKEKTNRNQKRQILPSSMKEDTSVVNEDCLKSRALATDGDETPHEETHREDSIAYTANVSVGQALSSMETQQITNIKQLQHMEISAAIEITGIDESASTLMFAGSRETCTGFTRGKWLKLYGFEVIPTVPKYDRGTWGFTLKIMDTTIVEEFQHSPPLLRLSVPTISIAEFTNMHRGRDSIGSIEAVMIKVNSLAHNTAEITVADNGDSSDTLTVKFLASNIYIFREMLNEFLSETAPSWCFINLQGDGVFKRANVSGMTIVTCILDPAKNHFLTALYRSLAICCNGVPGWFEIDRLRPIFIHTICSSCDTIVTQRTSKDTAVCAVCKYVGPVKQLMTLKGKIHVENTTRDVNIPSYLVDHLYGSKEPILTSWKKDSTHVKTQMIKHPPVGRFVLDVSNDVIGFVPSSKK
ncbi:hypothetical protein SELMODRAFT_403003 [Selaginella moellendorffii]|uniref:Uncharacterized protein n=1 Tax=Selaginella moellendorffii TaxID=88036 RepID=D8QNR2_SELML|nr:hypothetical protein SELMODRAFT_403003 [Selaginella moellendorffii]